MKNILFEIAYCENIKKVQSNDGKLNCACKTIVDLQEESKFQLPEPWNGDIENCRILYVSSNPSINQKEKYPTKDWEEKEVLDFFKNRFSKDKKWVEEELRPLCIDDNGKEYYPPPKKWVRFWGALRSISRDLLKTDNVIPGKDYAMTEIVHCKSTKERGVAEALDICAEKYLDKIFNISASKLIVCLGTKVSKYIKSRYSISCEDIITEFPNTRKFIMFLPHPNARVEKKISKLISEEKLDWIQNKLKK